MEIKPVSMVLADISGYTSFIKQHPVGALHAEQHITSLLESVVAKAEFPLAISKFEGDAVFMYAVGAPDPAAVARSVLQQVCAFFDAFNSRQHALVAATNCTCDACKMLPDLKLKVICHSGDVVFKQIREFTELGGEPAIVIHRLLKNGARSKEYILMTDAFLKISGGLTEKPTETRIEEAEGIGPVNVTVYYVGPVPPPEPIKSPEGFFQKLRRAFSPVPKVK